MPMLTWLPTHYNSHYGMSGKVILFTISMGSTRNDPQPWKMRTDLPGLTRSTYPGDSVDALKGRAERILARWLERRANP